MASDTRMPATDAKTLTSQNAVHYGKTGSVMEGTCPILGRTTPQQVVDSREPWTLVQCGETGFVYLQDPPDYSQLIEEYAWEKT